MVRTRLEILSLTVLHGEGRTTERCRVRCPRSGRPTALECCLGCPDGGGLGYDPGARSEYAVCLAPARGNDPGRTGDRGSEGAPISAAMTTDVVAARPDVSLEAMAALLLGRGIGGAPVVDADGNPLGIVTRSDLLSRRADPRSPARAVLVPEQASVGMVLAVMVRCAARRVLVLGADGSMTGIVTASDLTRWLAWGERPAGPCA